MILEKFQIKNNIDENTDFTTCHLSIQISLGGFCFAIVDQSSENIISLKEFEFTDKTGTTDILWENLREVYQQEPVLNELFASVSVAHKTPVSTLVPEELFDPEHLSDYLKFNFISDQNPSLSYENLEDKNVLNVFLPLEGVNQFFTEKYGEVTFHHTTSILLNNLLKNPNADSYKQFYLNVNKNFLDIVYLLNGQIQFYNTFAYQSKEDFLYYVLSVMEQMYLNPQEQTVTLLGEIDKNSDLFEACKLFINHLEFINIQNFRLPEDFYTQNENLRPQHYFELLNQF